MITYTNPQLNLTVTDWPYGRFRTTAVFTVEKNKQGERVSRITTNPKTGAENAPKRSTYATLSRIVDGSDGKTYIMQLTSYGFIKVMQSDMQHAYETIFADNERYTELLKLFTGGIL